MNIKLTLDFTNMNDLAAFVSATQAAETPAPAPAQSPAEVVPMTPPAEPAPAPEMPPMPEPPAPAAETAPVDLEALRQDLATRLRALVDKLGPDPIRDFVNRFGIEKFSMLPDDQLQPFDTALREEYGQ